MDEHIAAAARALACGDPLGALNYVALRGDTPALALRGIAMAQLGEFATSRRLLRRAAHGFARHDPVAHARCIVAEAEVALAARDLVWPAQSLPGAQATLLAYNDHRNAAHARLLQARHLLITNRLSEAEEVLRKPLSPTVQSALHATRELLVACIAMRRLRTRTAHDALRRASALAREAGIPALEAEVMHAIEALNAPAARVVVRDDEQLISLAGVEALHASDRLIIDACRHSVYVNGNRVPLASRPILFKLAFALGRAWPCDTTRAQLIGEIFRIRHIDESHKARLRVEMGRLRKALRGLADITATTRGFMLQPSAGRAVTLLARPIEETHAPLLALLADGDLWSSSAMALALHMPQRNVQRALRLLAQAGKVQWVGQGRARRWMMPSLPGITTILLLPAPLPFN